MKRPDPFVREPWSRSLAHGQVTTDTTIKFYKVPVGKKLLITRASYINPTGLAGDGTNAFAGYIKNGSTVVATLFNTDTGDTGGASLAADTFVEGTLSATPASLWFAAGDVVSLVLDEDATSTLEAGLLDIEGYLY